MFIELINFDQQGISLEHQLKQAQQDIAALESQERESLKKAELLHRLVYDAKKNVDAKELEMKSLEQAELEKKERLKHMTGHKEYKSVKIEIDRLNQQQHALEQELLVAWKQLESAQKTHEEQTVGIKNRSQELHDIIQTKKTQIDELVASIAQQTSIRQEKAKTVPAEWLEKYAMMRTQVQDPVVPVQQGSCSACFYKVTEHDMQQLRRNKLMQCKDCYRFIYLEASGAGEEKI